MEKARKNETSQLCVFLMPTLCTRGIPLSSGTCSLLSCEHTRTISIPTSPSLQKPAFLLKLQQYGTIAR